MTDSKITTILRQMCYMMNKKCSDKNCHFIFRPGKGQIGTILINFNRTIKQYDLLCSSEYGIQLFEELLTEFKSQKNWKKNHHIRDISRYMLGLSKLAEEQKEQLRERVLGIIAIKQYTKQLDIHIPEEIIREIIKKV